MSYLKEVLLVLVGGAGVMGAGWFTARAQNKRTRLEDHNHRMQHYHRRDEVDSVFMERLLERVTKLEHDLVEERRRCEEDKLELMRLAEKDKEELIAKIEELKERITHD